MTFNSDIGGCRRACFVGQDLFQSGRIAAGLMAKMVPAGKVLVVTSNLLFQAQRQRLGGFRAAWPGAPETVEVLEGLDQRAVTEERVIEALFHHPDIAGLYLASSPLKACLSALKNRSGPRIRVVCNDLLPETREALESGLVDFTILQDEFQQGYRPLRLLFEKLTSDRPWPREHDYVESTIFIKESFHGLRED